MLTSRQNSRWRPISITADAELTEFSDRWAQERLENALRKNWKSKGGQADGSEAQRTEGRNGMRGEGLGKRWLDPVHWNYFLPAVHKGIPDLDDFIDVKTVMKPDHRLIVAEDDRPDFAYLLVYAGHYPRGTIRGWLWGYEVKLVKPESPPRDPENPVHIAGHWMLHDPMELYEIVHGKVGTKRDRITAHRLRYGLPSC